MNALCACDRVGAEEVEDVSGDTPVMTSENGTAVLNRTHDESARQYVVYTRIQADAGEGRPLFAHSLLPHSHPL